MEVVLEGVLIKVMFDYHVDQKSRQEPETIAQILIFSILDISSDSIHHSGLDEPAKPRRPHNELTLDKHGPEGLKTGHEDILVIIRLCIINIFELFSAVT